MTSSELRAKILAACDAAYDSAMRRRGFGSSEVRHGILAAQTAVTQEPLDDDPLRWIERADRALARVRSGLENPADDDGWALGGVATIRRLVEDAREELRKDAPRRAITSTEALLRLAGATRRAFPDRADALLAAAEGWFHVEGNRTCSLCSRTLSNNGNKAIEICPACAGMRGRQDVPDEHVLLDLLRAIRASGDERADELCAELERRYRLCELRPVEDARCAACGAAGPAVAGRIVLCFACLPGAGA
jgi:hypothetical protein